MHYFFQEKATGLTENVMTGKLQSNPQEAKNASANGSQGVLHYATKTLSFSRILTIAHVSILQ